MDHKTRAARVSEREANESKLSELSFNAGFGSVLLLNLTALSDHPQKSVDCGGYPKYDRSWLFLS
jgi:hypothetical protein